MNLLVAVIIGIVGYVIALALLIFFGEAIFAFLVIALVLIIFFADEIFAFLDRLVDRWT